MLRADWTRKHRERRPAVALAFLPHEEVEGDPNAWVSLTRRIDALRDAAAGAGCALALVVVGDARPPRTPEDRVAALTLSGPDRQVRPGVHAPAANPGRDESRGCAVRQPREGVLRRRVRQTRGKTLPGRIEAAEPGFKAGIFSEFHGDWGGAWRMYKTAYDGLVAAHVAAEAAGGGGGGCGMAARPAALKTQLAAPKPSAPCRRGFERMAVAERLHYKLCALHLTPEPRGPPGCAWRRCARTTAFRHRPGGSHPPRCPALVVGGEAAQSLRRAPLPTHAVGRVRERSRGAAAGTMPLPSPPPPNAPMTYLPGFWYHAAANATERASPSRRIGGCRRNSGGDGAAAAIVDGKYVGTFARGDGPITDAEYLGHVNARLPSAPELVKTSIELLTKAHDHFKRTAPKDGSAKLRQAVRLHRRQAGAWVPPRRGFRVVQAPARFRGAGLQARGVGRPARRCPDGDEGLREARKVKLGVSRNLPRDCGARRDQRIRRRRGDGRGAGGDGGCQRDRGYHRDGHDAQVGSLVRRRRPPARQAMHCVAGFGASHAVPGEPIELTVAVRSCLPATLPVKSVTAVFGDGLYDWTSEDAVSELPARTWRLHREGHAGVGTPGERRRPRVNPRQRRSVQARARRWGQESPRRGWLAPDERLPAAVDSGCNLGVHSLNLREPRR